MINQPSTKPIEIYKQVLEGKLSRFPKGFWNNIGLANEKAITEYLIETVLEWDKSMVCKKLSQKTFRQNKLGGMLNCSFSSSPYKALDNACSGMYKPWELSHSPINTWDVDTAIEALVWVIEVKCKLNDKQVLEEYGYEFVCSNGLKAAYSLFINEYEFINSAYPKKFKPWFFRQCPNDYWTPETKVEAMKWLVYEQLDLNRCEIYLTRKNFEDNGLVSLLLHHFNGSWREAIGVLSKGEADTD